MQHGLSLPLGSDSECVVLLAPFLENIFIDQATLNGTRPNSPSGVKPARPLVQCRAAGRGSGSGIEAIFQ
jgi:hypothetical protein